MRKEFFDIHAEMLAVLRGNVIVIYTLYQNMLVAPYVAAG